MAKIREIREFVAKNLTQIQQIGRFLIFFICGNKFVNSWQKPGIRGKKTKTKTKFETKTLCYIKAKSRILK
ncbi:hypothetical protein C4F50_21525 [Flavobacterium sp. KB82]|uniref:Uncharacterized protein n=1 Tax=Flavobacterium hungaricum TaxID=2082725 RepID=A0ABR9TR22_9FLAO|nr:hypothetical protein [Flavobacterium hungaricum]